MPKVTLPDKVRLEDTVHEIFPLHYARLPPDFISGSNAAHPYHSAAQTSEPARLAVDQYGNLYLQDPAKGDFFQHFFLRYAGTLTLDKILGLVNEAEATTFRLTPSNPESYAGELSFLFDLLNRRLNNAVFNPEDGQFTIQPPTHERIYELLNKKPFKEIEAGEVVIGMLVADRKDDRGAQQMQIGYLPLAPVIKQGFDLYKAFADAADKASIALIEIGAQRIYGAYHTIAAPK